MTTFTLAADPIRSWDVLLSPEIEYRVQMRDDKRVVLGGTVDGLPATIEYSGSNFGASGAGLSAGTAPPHHG